MSRCKYCGGRYGRHCVDCVRPARRSALHLWYLLPGGETVGLVVGGESSDDVMNHVKDALERGAVSISIMREAGR